MMLLEMLTASLTIQANRKLLVDKHIYASQMFIFPTLLLYLGKANLLLIKIILLRIKSNFFYLSKHLPLRNDVVVHLRIFEPLDGFSGRCAPDSMCRVRVSMQKRLEL